MTFLKYNSKSTFLIIFLLIISSNLYSQKRQYSISAGSDYTVSTNYTIGGKFGFHFSGDVAFPLNKHFSIKTGVGINQLTFSVNGSRTSEMTYFTGTTSQTSYNGEQPHIIPGSVIQVGDSSYIENTQPILIDSLHNYWGNNYNNLSNRYPSSYMTVMFNVPAQIQLNLFNNKLLLTTGTSISTIIYAENTIETKWIDPESINYADDSYIANSDFNTVFANVIIGAEYKILKNFYAGLYYERSITNPLKYSSIYLNNFSLNISYKLNK